MADASIQTSEPTVLAAIWKYRWLVLLIAIAFAGLGWLYGTQTADWTAKATLNVEDPRSTGVFDQAFPDSPERYVEGQVAIIESRAVARRAQEIAAEQSPPVVVTISEISSGLSVSASAASDIVTLRYSAPTQRESITVVNAVAVAYQEIGRQAADTTFENALVELDRSIVVLQEEITNLDGTISARQTTVLTSLEDDPDRIAQQLLLDELVAELHGLQPPSSSASVARFTQFENELAILTLRITTTSEGLAAERAAILAIESGDPERVALVALRDESQLRLSELQTRRDQLAVDADLASNGVVFFSPAEEATPSSAFIYIALGVMLGMVLGTVAAVLLSSRRKRFVSRSEPEVLLNTRLLADVPNFKEERIGSSLPVVDAPMSASAEAFRFVSASIALQQEWPARDDGRKNFKSLITMSSGLFEGKTVVTANTALATARKGHKVLVVDADFGNQQLTQLLLGASPRAGMTDVTSGEVSLKDAVVDVQLDGTGSVHLLSRGTISVQAPDFFSSQDTAALFNSLSQIYDLVIIDAPPILRVAYATTLARLADRAMVVIAHGEDTHSARELNDQMNLVGIPSVGYVYNFAPLRSEMAVSAGSMADTLGEHHATTHSVVLRPE